MSSNSIPQAARQLRKNIAGLDQKVPVLGGRGRRYIYLDNAASTPALVSVLQDINEIMKWYAGVHRGTGYKSLLSSRIYDESHDVIAQFVGADPVNDSVIMVKNTTEAINKLSRRIAFNSNDIVLTTEMEHHSNDLPWRAQSRVQYAGLNEKGQLDLLDLEARLKQYHPRVKMLAVCGASNVTGHINDVHRMAVMAHDYGAKILVDGAQLIPHHRFDMKPHGQPDHIDYLAFSAHKIYAPFGSGVLIGPKDTFQHGQPDYTGGGTVNLVMKDKIYWADLPDKEEAGSPNVPGAYALARTLQYLDKIGMEDLIEYEKELTAYALGKISEIKQVVVYGTQPRVGVISFNIEKMHHALVGAVLCYEAATGVRTGCFCAQNYVRKLLGIEEKTEHALIYEQKQLHIVPGMVRISLGGYNTREEIDHLVSWIKKITLNRDYYGKHYVYYPQLDGFAPVGIGGKMIERMLSGYI